MESCNIDPKHAAGVEGGIEKRESVRVEVELELGRGYNENESEMDAPVSFRNPMHTAEVVESLRSVIVEKDEEIVKYRKQVKMLIQAYEMKETRTIIDGPSEGLSREGQ